MVAVDGGGLDLRSRITSVIMRAAAMSPAFGTRQREKRRHIVNNRAWTDKRRSVVQHGVEPSYRPRVLASFCLSPALPPPPTTPQLAGGGVGASPAKAEGSKRVLALSA